MCSNKYSYYVILVLVVAIAAFRYAAMAVVKKEIDGAIPGGDQVVPVAPLAKAPSPAPAKGAKKQKTQDFRLAQVMEDQRFVREQLRENNRLISWPPEKTNVITLEALGLHHRIMSTVSDFHCSQSNTVKPPVINYLKAQVGIIKNNVRSTGYPTSTKSWEPICKHSSKYSSMGYTLCYIIYIYI